MNKIIELNDYSIFIIHVKSYMYITLYNDSIK